MTTQKGSNDWAPNKPLEPGRSNDQRSQARQLALQFLYQLAVQGGANLDQIDFFLNEYGQNTKSRSLARSWIRGAWQGMGQIDRMIQSVSSNWDLHRISQVDRANLRLAVYQMLHCPDIPMKVVINEAVELAKVFSTAQSPGFVNGVLDAIRGKLAEEMGEGL